MIRLMNKYGHNDHSFLSIIDEVTRKNMVGKVKAQSPSRYNNRLHYKAGTSDIDFDKLIPRDIIVIKTNVGKYECIIAYDGVLHELRDIVKSQPKPYVNLQSVIRAITKSIDDTDIKVDCDCGDFKYRFAYWATKYGYKYGTPETRPSRITNPDDKLGAMCKHLTSILSNKRWLVKVASILNNFIKSNIKEIRAMLAVTDSEFVVNQNRSFTPPKNDTKPSNDNTSDNSEELEIDDSKL